MVSENLYSKSYAKTTATAASKQHAIGPYLSAKDRFSATSRQEYNDKNFRRYVNDKSMKPRKDYNEYSQFVNKQYGRSQSVCKSYESTPL